MLADLHRHLDGSLRPRTLHELAREKGLGVPHDSRSAPAWRSRDALARFRSRSRFLQEPAAVTRVAREICEDAVVEA